MIELKKFLLGVVALGAAILVFFFEQSGDTAGRASTDSAGVELQAVTAARTSRSSRPMERATRAGFGSRVTLESLEDLAARDPQRALVELANLSDPDQRSLALASIAAGWGRSDPQAAAAWVSALESDEDRVEAVLGLVPIWGGTAPESCLEWVATCPPGNLREVAFVELADAWGGQEPQSAYLRFLSLENEQGRERGLHVIVSQWALDSPEMAVAALSKDESPRRDEMLEAALVSLTNEDPELAWNYSDRFTDAETVEHVRSMALEAMAEERPQDAIKWAESGGNSETLLAGVARGWAMNDRAAAQRWIASLPDVDLTARLMKEISE